MKSLLTASLLVFVLTTGSVEAIEFETGVEGLTIPAKVVAPVKGLKPPDPVPAAKLEEPVKKTVPANPPVTDLKDKKHLKEAAENFAGQKPAQATFPKTAGTGQTAAVEQSGKGSSEYEAFADGKAELLAFLPTYRPARIIVRLFDRDGEEIFFKGQSLLVWERPDDKAYAPLFFKGSSDETSMKKISGGNFDAVQNQYSFEIEQGQKLRLEISGQPENSSYIKAGGPLQ